ncbi:hypothetical protein EVAR_37682_1, partial [Eumeta japonica]
MSFYYGVSISSSLSSIIRHWIPSSDKVLVKRNHKSSNSMGYVALLQNSNGHLQPFIRPWISSKYKILSRQIMIRAQTRWVMSYYGVLWLHLPATSSDTGYHLVIKYWSRGIIRAKLGWGYVCFITEFQWLPFTSFIRPWISSKYKILVKTNDTSPNSMGLCRFIMEFLWPPPSSITSDTGYHLVIKPWISSKYKNTRHRNDTSPNSMALCRFITGSGYGHLPAPSSGHWIPSSDK